MRLVFKISIKQQIFWQLVNLHQFDMVQVQGPVLCPLLLKYLEMSVKMPNFQTVTHCFWKMIICRKAYMKTAKHLISNSHETASADCMRKHRQKREFAAQVMNDICKTFGNKPVYLTHFREMVLSALAYTRQELLWYFSHINEVRCLAVNPPSPGCKVFTNSLIYKPLMRISELPAHCSNHQNFADLSEDKGIVMQDRCWLY